MIPKSVQRFSEKIMLKQEARADDDSRKNHPALVLQVALGSLRRPGTPVARPSSPAATGRKAARRLDDRICHIAHRLGRAEEDCE